MAKSRGDFEVRCKTTEPKIALKLAPLLSRLRRRCAPLRGALRARYARVFLSFLFFSTRDQHRKIAREGSDSVVVSRGL
jgi:hypothetical protein